MGVRFIFLQSVKCGEHNDRKGHHYYTTPFARPSCIVVMTLAAIMRRGGHHEAVCSSWSRVLIMPLHNI